jgi:hypothetical protein
MTPRRITIALLILTVSPLAHADLASEKRARCATRLSIALLGKSADAALLAAANPQDSVDAMVARPEFVERFARFVNATFNDELGMKASEDPAYFLVKEILNTSKPWRDLFVGKYNVDVPTGQTAVAVTADPNGLGYFRSLPWLRRYAGNEEQGAKLVTAYRIVNNVVGVKLTPTTNAPGADTSATGRMSPACAGCHYQGPFALDLIARILTKRVGQGDTMTFTPPTAGPQGILDTQIGNDGELVSTLVNSDSFKFRACRLAFLFLTGRAENQCEAPAFDACIDAFNASGKIQSAIASVAKNPGFCQ